ncbi:MAG: aminotransferase class I/II-fold pyridoxal phosphate-dependent enzyme [Phycisphaerales bacterium]
MQTDHSVARRLAPFGESVFTPYSRLAREHRAINLGQGFPDFDGPKAIRDAAVRAMDAGHNQYAPPHGVPDLQSAIADWTAPAGSGSAPIDAASMVTVTAGCTEAIAATMLGLLEPGDEVIALEPFYDAYPATAALAGASLVPVPLRGPRFEPDLDAFDAAFTPRTKAVLLNTPHNPTGTVLGMEALDRMAAACIRHDVVCITDEVYERLIFDGEHVRMRDLPGMAERTITLSSLGKTFSYTGWKIGWSVAPPALTAGVRAAHQFLTYAVAHPFQHAAAAALRLEPGYFDDFIAGYRQRRDRLVAGLKEVGFPVVAPAGGYFVMADHTAFGWDDDHAFCQHLIAEVGVAAIPASAFYADGRGAEYVRFAFCKDLETIDAAIDRLRRGLRT